MIKWNIITEKQYHLLTLINIYVPVLLLKSYIFRIPSSPPLYEWTASCNQDENKHSGFITEWATKQLWQYDKLYLSFMK
jgi:hypothetical protein